MGMGKIVFLSSLLYCTLAVARAARGLYQHSTLVLAEVSRVTWTVSTLVCYICCYFHLLIIIIPSQTVKIRLWPLRNVWIDKDEIEWNEKIMNFIT